MQSGMVQSGMVQSHHPGQTHPTMMLMATQGPPGGPQQAMPQNALNPIPVSSTTHFSYLAHPQGMFNVWKYRTAAGWSQEFMCCYTPFKKRLRSGIATCFHVAVFLRSKYVNKTLTCFVC